MSAKKTLIESCSHGENSCTEFLDWCNRYPALIGKDSHALHHNFNRYARQFERMKKAAARPMGVAVFGPSQAGKSYLISALARKDTAPLVAKFGEHTSDFVKEINPGGGKESTGIVTRFTTKPNNSPYSDFPVVLRLLSELDIIKIVINAYLSDVKASSIPRISDQELDDALEKAKQSPRATQTSALNSRDVYDLRNYLAHYFRGIARLEAFDDAVWSQLIDLLPSLDTVSRSVLLSLFWGEHSAFTELYARLSNALQRLGNAEHAFCALETDSDYQGALLPRSESVIDVATLSDLGLESSDMIGVRSESGASVSIRRCDLAALVSELVIQMEDKPYDYFDHTDLLDFPGYRSREEIKDVDDFLSDPQGLPNFFLRGKVDYLYRRYREDRELSSMILCIAGSNQNVNSLPEAVFEWISDSHGETPEQRANKPVTLFLALTMFDMEFEEKQGVGEKEEDYINQWETRLHASVWSYLGKQHDWVENWDNNGPFDNMYWIRNPNFKAKHIFDYDAKTGLEIGRRQSEIERIDKLRNGFIQNSNVTKHFQEPSKAFDQALELNQGGVSYLALALGKICDPNLKSTQLKSQVTRLNNEIKDQLSHYFVGDDHTQMMEKRINTSQDVIRTLARCAEAGRFGNFLKEIQVSEDDATRIYYRLHKEGPSYGTETQDQSSEKVDSFLSGILDDKPKEAGDQSSNISHFADAFADEILGAWHSKLNDVAADTLATGYYQLSSQVVLDLINEFRIGANRLALKHKIATIVSATERKRLNVHDAVKLPARRAARIINDLVNYLGFDLLPLSERPTVGSKAIFTPVQPLEGLPILSPSPQLFEVQYTRDWFKAYLDFVIKNVNEDPYGESGSNNLFNPEANKTLGELIEGIDN